MNTYIFGQLIFDKNAKAVKWGKANLFSNWYWNCIIICKNKPQTIQKLTQNGP